MLLDEVVLEEQRLLGVVGDDGLDVADELGEQRNEQARVLTAEVLAHASAQASSLAHVHDLAVTVAHEVDRR
jgi:hypothetical protein